MIPGRMLHRLAARICSAKTLEHVIEPAIADVQKEHTDAVREGGVWLGRWVLFLGYVGIAKALALCGIDSLLRNPLSVGPDDRRLLVRTLAWSGLFILLMTAALMIPLLEVSSRDLGLHRAFLMALISQTLPLVIPVGLTLGVMVGVDGRPMTHRHRRRVLGLAAASAAAAFVTLCWIMPATNQAFRVHVMQTNGGGYPMKGASEMTPGELSREIRVAAASGSPSLARELAFAYHLKGSLAFGVIALVFFASSVSQRSLVLRLMLGVLACVLYWICLFVGDELSRGNIVPVLLGAWLPNLAVIGVSAGLLNQSRPRIVVSS